MARELFITIYLFVFRSFFNLFKLLPQKKKTVFVASFGDNIMHTLKEVERQTSDQVVILKDSQCKINFNHPSHRIILDFSPVHLIDWFKSIYHLATSEKVFVDNYYGFLAVTNFHSNVPCVQLWHAAGAIKQFGLKDPSNAYRSERAFQRFQKVYEKFDHVVIGSEKMSTIFKESFGITNEQILRSGIPRTDFFFDQKAKDEAKQSLLSMFPMINDRKVLLYAPTFRDNELNTSSIKLNIDQMYQTMKEDYVLLLRLHPAVHANLANDYPDFVINVSDYKRLNDLLIITDILITDYSSIPFEFSLLNKPMIFFAYDLEEYTKVRGFWENYEAFVPGPIVTDTRSLIDQITKDEFDFAKIEAFSDQWNQYSNGYSSRNLIDSLYSQTEEQSKAVGNG